MPQEARMSDRKFTLHESRATEPTQEELDLVSFQVVGANGLWVVTSTWKVKPEAGIDHGCAFWPVGATLEERFDHWGSANSCVNGLMMQLDTYIVG
jgi:hypothetical protein